MFEVALTFHGGLSYFLRREHRDAGHMRRTLAEKTAVKDVIESCGVPHPEVDLIVAGVGSVDFAWQVASPVALEVYSVPAPAEVFPGAARLQQPAPTRFVADGHLGKLVRNLRLLGYDTAYERDADDPRLLEIMAAEDRTLLTRDRPLLMHGIVRHGYCPRSDQSEEQTGEVLRRFGLHPASATFFTRCLHCNGALVPVAKSEVTEELADEPLTLRYHDDFRRCAGCRRVYWPGTHAPKLTALAGRLGDRG